ncbi:MAG: DUF5990 family protein [Opitutaceae bacterium]
MKPPESTPSELAIEVVCENLPARFCGERVYLGIQKGREVVEIVPGSSRRVTFRPTFRVTKVSGGPNFLGPYAQGTRDERFFYLSWGRKASPAKFEMYRRLKVHRSHLTWPQVQSALRTGTPIRVELDLTDRCGNPRCASAWTDDPGVVWRL